MPASCSQFPSVANVARVPRASWAHAVSVARSERRVQDVADEEDGGGAPPPRRLERGRRRPWHTLVQVHVRQAGDPQVLELRAQPGRDEGVARDLNGGRLDEEDIAESRGGEQAGAARDERTPGKRNRHAEK